MPYCAVFDVDGLVENRAIVAAAETFLKIMIHDTVMRLLLVAMQAHSLIT